MRVRIVPEGKRYSCYAKTCYSNVRAAREAAARARKRSGDESIWAYRCDRAKRGCGKWHIGGDPQGRFNETHLGRLTFAS